MLLRIRQNKPLDCKKNQESDKARNKVVVSLSKKRWLLYDPDEIEGIRAQKADWLSFFMNSRKQALMEQEPLDKTYNEGKMTVSRYYPPGQPRSIFWQAGLNGKTYFIKETSCKFSWQIWGPAQYIDLLALKFIPSKWVRPVRPIMAFSDRKVSFLVTEFLSSAREDLKCKKRWPKPESMQARELNNYVQEAKRRYNIVDLEESNVTYIPWENKYVVLDPIRAGLLIHLKITRQLEKNNNGLDERVFRDGN